MGYVLQADNKKTYFDLQTKKNCDPISKKPLSKWFQSNVASTMLKVTLLRSIAH